MEIPPTAIPKSVNVIKNRVILIFLQRYTFRQYVKIDFKSEM